LLLELDRGTERGDRLRRKLVYYARLAGRSEAPDAIPCPGFKPAHLNHFGALDLLDFASTRAADVDDTDFVCWILVGFRAALNVGSHPKRLENSPLTCDFDEWAVLGSNQ
jgi:hypothetical protein